MAFYNSPPCYICWFGGPVCGVCIYVPGAQKGAKELGFTGEWIRGKQQFQTLPFYVSLRKQAELQTFGNILQII